MAKQSKRFRALAANQKSKEAFPLSDAVKTLKGYDGTKFDQMVEIAMRLGIDHTQADQIVRGSIVLPHGIGKEQRVVVFAKGPQAEAAKAAGADEVGDEDLSKKILGGWTDFDVCIAAPDMMKLVGPLGRVLGPRGLMPSPRAGTVTPDVGTAVSEYKAGKVEFRNDKGGNIHAPVGKLSFDPEKLSENVQAFVDKIVSMKPAAVKGVYLKGVHLSATMSPSVRVAV
ncbi:50S ribosomal protein L1 [Posidoniimonas polymericola]|uniref:Large ribosomal subunit protein uL1 n=1 Tax=Posidoniimonas polymericola TaxID=2528002 RepID=A0A5C5YF03_9BACT|nr:50S ribosomal protein L1 [Posidoniimonas polymericola]TWT73644.1 50S ribosomal protein L1 [Posidoniimonas polymericola]